MKNYKLKQWYKIDGTNVIFYANKKNEEGQLFGYGISFSGDWYEGVYGNLKDGIIAVASDREVKDALVSERHKRYSIGDKVNYLDTGKGKIWGRSFIYDDCVIYSSDHPNNQDILFKDGEWAEVIKITYLTKKQAEDRINELENNGKEYKIMNSIMDYR